MTPSDGLTTSEERRPRKGGRHFAGGAALIIVGLLLLAHRFVPELRLDDYWPLLLVGLGGYILWKSGR